MLKQRRSVIFSLCLVATLAYEAGGKTPSPGRGREFNAATEWGFTVMARTRSGIINSPPTVEKIALIDQSYADLCREITNPTTQPRVGVQHSIQALAVYRMIMSVGLGKTAKDSATDLFVAWSGKWPAADYAIASIKADWFIKYSRIFPQLEVKRKEAADLLADALREVYSNVVAPSPVTTSSRQLHFVEFCYRLVPEKDMKEELDRLFAGAVSGVEDSHRKAFAIYRVLVLYANTENRGNQDDLSDSKIGLSCRKTIQHFSAIFPQEQWAGYVLPLLIKESSATVDSLINDDMKDALAVELAKAIIK